MGGSSSKPPSPEEERKRQLAESGVLIPPSFGVGTGASLEYLHHSFLSFDIVSQQLPCNRLLHEFLAQPGVWISATTASDGSVLASYRQKDNKAMLCASQQVMDGPFVQVRADSSSGGTPHVAAYHTFMNGFQMHGTFHPSGCGRLGYHIVDIIRLLPKTNPKTHQEYYRNNPFEQEEKDASGSVKVQLGSWADFNAGNKEKVINSVTGFGFIKANDYAAAVEAIVPVKQSNKNEIQLSYLAAFDLNSNPSAPLTVTLTKTPSESKMALSQLISFDRFVTNLLEERCPKIRNTIGWSVQMASSNKSEENLVSAACAWQINRGLALKVLASPTTGVAAGIVLKRWKEPRVTCCLSLGKKNTGIHVEFETGPPFWQSKELYEYANAAHSDVAPATKTSLASDGEL